MAVLLIHIDSTTADNNSFEQWRDGGESTTEQRAAERVAETLANYEAPPLDEAIDDKLDKFAEDVKLRLQEKGIEIESIESSAGFQLRGLVAYQEFPIDQHIDITKHNVEQSYQRDESNEHCGNIQRQLKAIGSPLCCRIENVCTRIDLR